MCDVKAVVRFLKKWANPAYFLSPLFMRTIALTKGNAEYKKYLNSEIYSADEIEKYNVVPHMKCVASGNVSSPEGRIYNLSNARYITNYPDKSLLLDNNNAFITESSNTMTQVTSFNWMHTKRKDVASIEVAMPFRAVSNNYYHTLLDNAPRLYSLFSDEMKNHQSIDVLCVNKLTAVEQYLFEKLLPANAKVKLLDDKSSYNIKHCLFPTFVTRQFSGYVPSEILRFFEDKLMPNRPRAANKRIYISRKKAPVRKVINEDEVIKALSELGFKAYCLEDCTFQEQIELFYDAFMIVGPHGAGFTNLVFSKNVAVVEMFPYKYVKPSYYYLTQSINGVYEYTCTDGDDIAQDFNVDIDEMNAKVQSLLENKKVGLNGE